MIRRVVFVNLFIVLVLVEVSYGMVDIEFVGFCFYVCEFIVWGFFVYCWLGVVVGFFFFEKIVVQC